MLAEYFAYISTFIISSGLAAIGILVSYQLYQDQKKHELLILLYQQIFMISFFFYGIWGNIAFHEIISGIEINPVLKTKLSLYYPLLGFPFLVVSWFMLLKFAFNSTGYRFGKKVIVFFFGLFLICFITIYFVVRLGVIEFPTNPDLVMVRLFVLVNIVIQICFSIPFIKPRKGQKSVTGINKSEILVYLSGVAIYSAISVFYDILGFVSTCISIMLVFTVSISIPVFIRFKKGFGKIHYHASIDFETFCRNYEISKRESEIISEICTGKSNREISDKLFITVQTVKDHTSRIYFKTGVNSRIQLANLVREKTGLSS